MIFPAFHWLQHTSIAEAIRHSAALIALVESVHLVGLTLLLGTILMVDLTLLGHGIGNQPVTTIARQLRGWTIGGLVVMLASGPFILSFEAIRCYRTPAFWIKMGLLAAALMFHFTVHRRVVSADPPMPQRTAGMVGAVSLALWISVALAGKAIAIFPATPSPLDNSSNHPAIDAQRCAGGSRCQRAANEGDQRCNFVHSGETP